MNAPIDLLTKHQATYQVRSEFSEHPEVVLTVDGIRSRFPKDDTAEWKQLINGSASMALRIFKERLDGSAPPKKLIDADLETLALKIAIAQINMHARWKQNHEGYEQIDLMMREEDVNSSSAEDSIYFFCKDRYGEKHKSIAAALMEKTIQEFESWLEGRERFWMR